MEVHLTALDLSGAWRSDHERDLPAEDLQRAGRFAFERDRRRFLQARRQVRELLAGHAGVPAREVRIAADHRGKPFLVGDSGLSFSLSHSGDRGLLAVARGVAVGVDLEERTGRPGLRELAESVLTPAEREALPAGGEELERAFLTAWTRKEACLKALGIGLRLEPHLLEVGLDAARRKVAIPDDAHGTMMEVETVRCDPRFVASLAVAGTFPALRWSRGENPEKRCEIPFHPDDSLDGHHGFFLHRWGP